MSLQEKDDFLLESVAATLRGKNTQVALFRGDKSNQALGDARVLSELKWVRGEDTFLAAI